MKCKGIKMIKIVMNLFKYFIILILSQKAQIYQCF